LPNSLEESMKFVLLQTAIGDYRQKVLELLVDEFGTKFHVFAGSEHFDSSTKTRVSLGPHLTFVSNHFLPGRRLLLQTGMWRPVLEADVAILELNPRILSVWLLLVLRRILGKESVLWGHAWPRGGRHKRSDRVRNLLRRLGDTIVVYTETQARELRERMPGKRIIAAPNALYSRSSMGADPDARKATDFIYVGRLVSSKKPMLLLDAFALAVDDLPADCDLVFVGDGPLRRDLEARSRELGLESRVEFKGHVSDLEKLHELYSTSLASVSPGYVGLSITQSFAFGVPMIIARDEPHAPEIEAAVEGVNSRMFDSDSPSSLAGALRVFTENKDSWIERRTSIASDCAKRYSAELMAGRIGEAVREV
jgi:glycosyltransferase involved in cell wall biosynthesis